METPTDSTRPRQSYTYDRASTVPAGEVVSCVINLPMASKDRATEAPPAMETPVFRPARSRPMTLAGGLGVSTSNARGDRKPAGAQLMRCEAEGGASETWSWRNVARRWQG